ncbi:hypothetical protein [Butyrivibrio sp. INlla14]|uniref:hypothetical protein n=1 Tax=Butyrivibrio sp. INlla14 TaxID=1520808 RepID=UPI000876C675|nr:hypothetical protein [Butyrivibrio sp. INlla14]SCY03166.1 hypothetical protein SAMN02910371_00799 [Butyrivibrio sp. INlla14]
MAYSSMKKIINAKNAEYDRGAVTAQRYLIWQEQQMKKLDVFLACDRITDDEYTELVGMFRNVEAE